MGIMILAIVCTVIHARKIDETHISACADCYMFDKMISL